MFANRDMPQEDTIFQGFEKLAEAQAIKEKKAYDELLKNHGKPKEKVLCPHCGKDINKTVKLLSPSELKNQPVPKKSAKKSAKGKDGRFKSKGK